MSSKPIDGIGGSAPPPNIGPQDNAPPSLPTKPTIKPPLERPFSLSLPPENPAQAVVNNIEESNKETERLTKKSADEQKLQQIIEEQQAQDQLLNGPGANGV
jgi:predicted component of type VI protein secretion system